MYSLELLPTTDAATSFYTTKELNRDNAGFDLFVPEDYTFAPDERKLISMRVKAKLLRMSREGNEPVHYWMPPRSSISKTGLILLNSIGVIDKTYRGELMAFLWNSTSSEVTVRKGDRLVQIVAPDMGPIWGVTIVEALDETARGEGGFGSSGR
jgi:dUTP pyrophosphatase